MHCGEVFLVLVGGITGHSLRFLKEQVMIKAQFFPPSIISSLRGKNKKFLLKNLSFLILRFLKPATDCMIGSIVYRKKITWAKYQAWKGTWHISGAPCYGLSPKAPAIKKRVKSDRFQPINSLLQISVNALASLLLQEYLNNYAIDVHFRQKIFEL